MHCFSLFCPVFRELSNDDVFDVDIFYIPLQQ